MIVILIRHAERESSSVDALSSVGKRRARTLATMLSDAGITAIFTSEFTRTKQTAAPVAAALGLTPREIASSTGVAKTQILTSGGVVLVVGHSDTVPLLFGALGGPADVHIGEHEFDRMFIVTPGEPPASTLALHDVSG
jgi:phosphohistidine phosphatase SixA